MIQYPSRFILDFNIVDHVLPRENGGLPFNDSSFRLPRSVAAFFLDARFGILRFDVFLDVRFVRNLSPWEKEDLPFRLSSGDVFCTCQPATLWFRILRTGSQKMPAQKAKHESN